MRPQARPPEINVTPLVDVVLVLLIIFMVVIPQLSSGAAIDTPPARNPDPRTDLEHQAIQVSMTRHGDVYIERVPVARGEVLGELRQLHAREPDRPLVLKGDHRSSYGQVRDLFRECQSVGFPGVALEVAKPPDEEAEGAS